MNLFEPWRRSDRKEHRSYVNFVLFMSVSVASGKGVPVVFHLLVDERGAYMEAHNDKIG